MATTANSSRASLAASKPTSNMTADAKPNANANANSAAATLLLNAHPDLKALDGTRKRLLQLTNTLSALRRDIEASEALPSWPAMQTSFALLTHHLGALATQISVGPGALGDGDASSAGPGPRGRGSGNTSHNHGITDAADLDDEQRSTVLRTGHAFPLPSFPRDHEALLGQLLRKKLEVGVEAWADAARDTADKLPGSTGAAGAAAQCEDLWAWATNRARLLVGDVPWGADYTAAEREAGVESVRTGLRRKLKSGGDDDDDESDDDDDDESEEGGLGEGRGKADADRMDIDSAGGPAGPAAAAARPPMLALEELYRFQSAGVLPRRLAVSAAPTASGPAGVGAG